MSAIAPSEPQAVVLTPRPEWPPDAVAAVERLHAELAELRERAEQLQRALDSRVAIEQAKGILAERAGVDMRTAFELLRRAARSRQMRLHELAEQVVGSPATPPPVAHEIERLHDGGPA